MSSTLTIQKPLVTRKEQGTIRHLSVAFTINRPFRDAQEN